ASALAGRRARRDRDARDHRRAALCRFRGVLVGRTSQREHSRDAWHNDTARGRGAEGARAAAVPLGRGGAHHGRRAGECGEGESEGIIWRSARWCRPTSPSRLRAARFGGSLPLRPQGRRGLGEVGYFGSATVDLTGTAAQRPAATAGDAGAPASDLSAVTSTAESGRLSPLTERGPSSTSSANGATASATLAVTRIWPSLAASQRRDAALTTVPMAL